MPSASVMECPAKVNLFLELQSRRGDGYHNIGTLFQSVDCHDTLAAWPEADGRILLEGAEGIPGDPANNLIIRAAECLRLEIPAAAELGIRFQLEKRLPMGAGLGGGSSNAAAAFNLCNTIWKLGLTNRELGKLASRLGADIPFFLEGGSRFGEGIGEILTEAPAPYPFHVVIATPNCHVDTRKAYGLISPIMAQRRDLRWETFKEKWGSQRENPDSYGNLHNDFEAPVRLAFPEVDGIFQRIEAFAPVKAMLSGSGSSVFALFEDVAQAEKCLDSLKGSCRFSCLTRFRT